MRSQLAPGAITVGLALACFPLVHAQPALPAWERIVPADRALATAVGSATGVAYGANLYALVSAEKVLSSRDAETWTTVVLPNGHEGRGITYFRGLFVVALGGSSLERSPSNQWIATSPDARTWTRRATTDAGPFRAVASNGDLAVAISSGSSGTDLAISPDGLGWRGISVDRGEADLRHIVGHRGLRSFIAWGAANSGVMWHSRDGQQWQRVTLPGAVPNVPPAGVAAAGAGYIAAARMLTGEMRLFSSPDGLAWTPEGVINLAAASVGYGLITNNAYAAGRGAVAMLAVEAATAGGTARTVALLTENPAVRWPDTTISSNSGGSAQFRTTWIGYENGFFFVVDRALNGGFTGMSRFRFGPRITVQPEEITVVPPGTKVELRVVAAESEVTYQWRRNGTDLPGATGAVLVLDRVEAEQQGEYVAIVRDTAGRATASTPATVALRASVNPARIVNLSILTSLAGGDSSFMLGTVVGGSGTQGMKPLVVRAVGPSLAAFGVSDALEDTYFNVSSSGGGASVRVGQSDNWGGAVPLAETMARVGAFPLASPASLDAAEALVLPAGGYVVFVSAWVRGGASGGKVLAELYDATPNGGFAPTTPRLVNVSVLKQLGAGLTVGFVIGGEGSKTVLVRAVGPGLVPLGVTGTVADPRMTLFDAGSREVAANDDWGGAGAMQEAFGRVGAFALPVDSKDAVLLSTLAPGGYTVQVGSGAGGTGSVLMEVYEVP